MHFGLSLCFLLILLLPHAQRWHFSVALSEGLLTLVRVTC